MARKLSTFPSFSRMSRILSVWLITFDDPLQVGSFDDELSAMGEAPADEQVFVHAVVQFAAADGAAGFGEIFPVEAEESFRQRQLEPFLKVLEIGIYSFSLMCIHILFR